MNNSKLKESNIKWLGKIPDNWKTIKFNALYDLRNEKVSDKDFPPLSVTKMGIVPQLSNAAKTNNGDNRKLVEIGDFAINSRSDRRGSCGISKYEGSVSLINTVLKPINREMNPRYYGWLFKTVEFADEFYKWGHGIVDDLWTTNWQDMKNITLVCPSKTEQNKIADFLDKKVSQIDDISKKIQQEITDLEEYRKSIITKAVTKGLNPNVPMKDSGIPWIGKIPQNWKIIKGKYLFRLLSKPVKKDDQVITCFRDGQVTLRVKRRTTGFTMSDQEIGYQGIDKGDLVVHGMDGFAGAIGISDSRGKGSPVLNVLDSNQDKKYMMYCLRATAQLGVFQALAKGIRVRSADTRWSTLANLKYAIPPQSEQANVVNYLSNNSYKLNAIIQAKKDLVEKLNQYKQSIIYEYVTGKKQVPTEEGAVEWEARLTNAMNINNTSLID